MAELLGNAAIENAAVAWVMELERAAGRVPRDTRNSGAPADIESSGRVIEVKAVGRSSRGFDLWLEPRQFDEAQRNDDFYIYLVENVRQGDTAAFTLKVFGGDQLRRLIAGAREKHYYEVPIPVAAYDAAPTTVGGLDGVRRNLYVGALSHVDGLGSDRLDANAYVAYSSQALCVSVFGAIAEDPCRDEMLNAIFAKAGVGIGAAAAATVECEVRDEWELLREQGGSHPTCPDVLITWPGAVLTIESKFTEQLESCSQPRRSRTVAGAGGQPTTTMACSGSYEVGSDLATRTDAACRLTVREGRRQARRYWDIAPRLFQEHAITSPQRPCPFADGRYQLMRNLAFAAAWAERESLDEFGFVLAFVGGWRHAASTRALYASFRAMLLPEVAKCVGVITFEEIADVLRSSALSTWIDQRLADGLAAR